MMKQHNEIINGDIYLRSVGQFIGASNVRQTKLRELVYETYGNSSIETATKLNIFIDLSSVLHGLYSEHNRVIIDNVTDVSSAILNMCGHYRNFFRSALGVDTRIFLINSLNICDINIKFVSEYNKIFKENKLGKAQTIKMINNNLKLLEILCPYLPAIYFVNSTMNFETAVIIAYIIELLNDPNPNLIISHDMYPLQLCTQYRWTSYLYPFKTRSGKEIQDSSWMVPINDKVGFREYFWSAYGNFRKNSPVTINKLSKLSPINYPLYIAATVFPERNLKSLISNSNAISFIESIVGNEDIKILSEQFLNNPELVSKYPVGSLDARYKALDVQYMLPYYRNSPEAKNIKFLDLNDISTVNSICAKYYANNPIDLQKL